MSLKYKKLALIGAVFAVILVSGCVQETKEVDKISDLFKGDRKLGQEVIVKGQLVRGTEAGREYCPEGLYLKDETGSILLRTQGAEGEMNPLFSDATYVGARVIVRGKYPVQEFFCEALICTCDDYVLVEGIEAIHY